MRLARSSSLLVLAVAVALVRTAVAERQPYERYQSIVDRQMFGPLPAGFDPSKSPTEVSKSGGAAEKELTKEQEKVKSAIHFSVINVMPDGETAIGFTDNSDPKAPKHYYLKVGESRGGWEVKEADAKAATMTIAKDGVEVSLSLGGDSSKDGTTQQTAQTTAAAQASAPRRSPMLNTLGSRRRARQEREEADQRAAAKREEERAAAAKAREEEERVRREEEKAQREAEREEQRRQLEQIREELRKSREERQSQEEKDKESYGKED